MNAQDANVQYQWEVLFLGRGENEFESLPVSTIVLAVDADDACKVFIEQYNPISGFFFGEAKRIG